MGELTLDAANRIIAATFSAGRRMGLGRLTVAVLDSGGHLVSLQRQDGSEFLRAGLAVGKAYGAIGMGQSSRSLHERYQRAPGLFQPLSDMTGGKVVPVPGGVLIRDDDGAILGGVGVSGDTASNDEAAATAGIEAAGLLADHGQREEWRRT